MKKENCTLSLQRTHFFYLIIIIIIIIIIYFLPILELYIFHSVCDAFYSTLFVPGRRITVKRACLPWQSVTLLMVFVNFVQWFKQNFFTKMSTYVQDGGFKITNNNSNTNSGFHMVELSRAFYSLRIYLRMFPKLTKEHTITVKSIQEYWHLQLQSHFKNS